MNPTFETRLLRYIRRHLIETLTLVYFAPMVWGGFVPFDFKPHIPAPIDATFMWGLPQAAAHLPDVLSNVALYLPLGVLIRLSLIHRGWRRWTSLPVSLVIGFAISYATEWSQLYSPSRISSFADLLANAGGFLLGALGASTGYAFIEAAREAGNRLLDRWRDSWRARPVVAGAQVCAAGLLLAAIAPFDITFSPNRVIESVRATQLSPFSQQARLSTAITPSANAEPDALRSASYRESWLLGIEYVTTAAAYALFAMFLYHYLTAHCRVSDLRRGVWTVFVSGMVAVVGSAAKLFVISRTADVTDLLIAVFGAASGVIIADRFVRTWRPEIRDNSARIRAARRRLIGTGLAAWSLLIVARELAPFDFVLSWTALAGELKSIEWLPMEIYQRARLSIAFDDLVTKVFWYAGFGLLVSAWWRLRNVRREPGISTIAFAAGASIAALEFAQILLPTRTPSITDVLLATFGAASGAIAYRLTVAWIDEARVPQEAERILLNVDIPEHGDAPREPDVSRQRKSTLPPPAAS